MLTPDTFLLTLYVAVDDFCKAHAAPRCHPGPQSGYRLTPLFSVQSSAQRQLTRPSLCKPNNSFKPNPLRGSA